MAEIRMFDVYVSDCLKRWGQEFPIERGQSVIFLSSSRYAQETTLTIMFNIH
jgi:hypothetical protein